MHTIRTLEGPPEDLFYPPFRKIEFDDEAAIVTVSTHLRYAWTAIPGSADKDGVGVFMKANSERTEEERDNLPENPDKDDIRTPWRKAIYEQWNHVFWDVAGFLSEVGPGIGHLHPPSQDAYAVYHPSAGDANAAVVKKSWDTNVLVIPAYLEPSVSVRVFTTKAGEDGLVEKTLGTFDGSNTAEIWFVKSGHEVNVAVNSGGAKDWKGVAAVLVYGKLCNEDHWRPEDADGEDGAT
ncbi:hypothetical protein MMC30_005529 [Trapelia coarctata]|nr:hypothetical protein [Trapelia coarctata]